MVLRGAADHARAADIDLFNGLCGRDAFPGDGGLEGIEVDHHQVDGLNALGLGVSDVVGQVAPVEQAAVDARMEGLHAAVEAFRSACIGGHLLGFQPGLLQGAQGPACGQDPPTLGQQALRQRDQTHLVIHRDQCRRHVCPLNP